MAQVSLAREIGLELDAAGTPCAGPSSALTNPAGTGECEGNKKKGVDFGWWPKIPRRLRSVANRHQGQALCAVFPARIVAERHSSARVALVGCRGASKFN